MNDIKGSVRVRFAPSPTGFLHVGGARTALFNWLYARQKQGKFLLRIEDTDTQRSSTEMVAKIIEGLTWLGIHWDEEIVYQSKRIERYQFVCEKLLAENKAYYCYCSEEDNKKRESYRYDGRCRHLSRDEILRNKRQNRAKVVRFKVEESNIQFDDTIRGSLKFSNEIDDFIILKTDGMPTYHLAVVVDDYDMNITHVIRGDDHLSNTPKHALLYQALNWALPNYTHLPLILGHDKKRLSKRHGATSVSEYRDNGYLPDALFNYLSLLGWNPKDDREILSQEELIDTFSLALLSKSNAVFDEKKLLWMNGQYINRKTYEELYDTVLQQFQSSGYINSTVHNRKYVLSVINLLKSRVKLINEFADIGRYFFIDPEYYEEKATKKYWKNEDVSERIRKLTEVLKANKDFNVVTIESIVRQLAEKMEISAAKLIHPARLALTGVGVSPGIFEVMELLGKKTVIRRLEKAVYYFTAN